MKAMPSVKAQKWEDAENVQGRVDRVLSEHRSHGGGEGGWKGSRDQMLATACGAGLGTLDVFTCGDKPSETVYTGQGLGSDVMVQDRLSLLPLPGKLFE